MKTNPTSSGPSDRVLASTLGSLQGLWTGIVNAMSERYAPLDLVWKKSKLDFGHSCRLQRKGRTLLYLMPDSGAILVAVVLGERAFHLALKSDLPAYIKKLLTDSHPYIEGRGIRFHLHTADDVPVVLRLVELKLQPK